MVKKHVGVGATKVYATNVIYHWIESLKVMFEAKTSNRHRIRGSYLEAFVKVVLTKSLIIT